MKKLITILLILYCAVGMAQEGVPRPPNYTFINQNYDWYNGKFRGLHLPAGTTPYLTSKQYTGAGAVFVDSVNHRFYFYSGGVWRFGGGNVDSLGRRDGIDSIDVYREGDIIYSIDLKFPTVNVDVVNGSTYTSLIGAVNLPESNTFGGSAGNVEDPGLALWVNAFGSDALDGATGVIQAVNSFGRNSLAGSDSAQSINAFGAQAGEGSDNAFASNFFGQNTGRNSVRPHQSNFIGFQAGMESGVGLVGGPQNVTWVGTNVGNEAGISSANKTVFADSNYSVMIGKNLRTNGFKNGVLLGGSTSNSVTVLHTADNQFLVAPNITVYRFSDFTYNLSAAGDTLATRAYARSFGGGTSTDTTSLSDRIDAAYSSMAAVDDTTIVIQRPNGTEDTLVIRGSTDITLPADIVYEDSVQTLTNKRWTARVGSTTSSATPTINTDNYDIYKLTAQAADITSFTTNLTGTPTDGQILEIQITGTAARAITWGSSFVASTVNLPSTTVTTATLTVVFQYFTTSSYGNNKWVIVNSF